eukprot:SAG31_NODE_333_length_17527_cov_6.972056_1_plen_164_part_00
MPTEILTKVLLVLDSTADLLAAGSVCRAWRDAESERDGLVWKYHGVSVFGDADAAAAGGSISTCLAFVESLAKVQRGFQQDWTPAALSELRRKFADSGPPACWSSLSPKTTYWKLRFGAFGRGLAVDPFRGRPISPVEIQCTYRGVTMNSAAHYFSACHSGKF